MRGTLLALSATLLFPVGGATATGVGEVCVDVTPEAGNLYVAPTLELTARLMDVYADCRREAAAAPTTVLFEVVGSNDPDDAMSPEGADYSCTVAEEDFTCSVAMSTEEEGDTTVYAWVALSGATEDEIDGAEGTDETRQPGTAPEPDATDVVGFRFFPGDYPQCNDDVDNDGDGTTDHPDDSDCLAPDDNNESPPQCSDGIDNDGDDRVDHPSDPDCNFANDNDESLHHELLTIRYRRVGGRFVGRLYVRLQGCARGRAIAVRKQRPGRDRVVGRDRSNPEGRWTIIERRAHGVFYAVAKRSSFYREGRRFLCQSIDSPRIRVRRSN